MPKIAGSLHVFRWNKKKLFTIAEQKNVICRNRDYLPEIKCQKSNVKQLLNIRWPVWPQYFS